MLAAIQNIQDSLGIEQAEAIELLQSNLPQVHEILTHLQTISMADAQKDLHKLNNALPFVGAISLQHTIKAFETDVHRGQIDWSNLPPFYQARFNQILRGVEQYLSSLHSSMH